MASLSEKGGNVDCEYTEDGSYASGHRGSTVSGRGIGSASKGRRAVAGRRRTEAGNGSGVRQGGEYRLDRGHGQTDRHSEGSMAGCGAQYRAGSDLSNST